MPEPKRFSTPPARVTGSRTPAPRRSLRPATATLTHGGNRYVVSLSWLQRRVDVLVASRGMTAMDAEALIAKTYDDEHRTSSA